MDMEGFCFIETYGNKMDKEVFCDLKGSWILGVNLVGLAIIGGGYFVDEGEWIVNCF